MAARGRGRGAWSSRRAAGRSAPTSVAASPDNDAADPPAEVDTGLGANTDAACGEPTFGEAVEANAFFAEVATATPTATDDDIPTKVWNGSGQLPMCMHIDDYGLFKLAWEAKGYKVIKVWNGSGQLPNYMHTDDYGLFKLAWEAEGFKVIKGP